MQLFCHVQDVWLEQEDAQLLHDGEEVTLMDWGNAIVEKVQRGADGHSVTGEFEWVKRLKCCETGRAVPFLEALQRQEILLLEPGQYVAPTGESSAISQEEELFLVSHSRLLYGLLRP